MLESIKLDDRSYQDIRDEAVKNIIKHCPEWTNHNPSDPGITLIELFSAMTEMTQYRLNQVPEKNYLAFLDLIGIKQRLAIPSSTRVQVKLSEGFQADNKEKSTITLPKGSTVTTEPLVDEEPIIFETENDLKLSNIKLKNIYSKKFNTHRQRDEISNHTDKFLNQEPFSPFLSSESSANKVEICFYSDEFNVFLNDTKSTIMFRLPTTMREFNISKNFLNRMKWEYYDGFHWQDLTILPNYQLILDDKDADVIAVTFDGNNDEFDKGIIERFSDKENFFIKTTFEEIPDWLNHLSIYEVSLVASSNPDGVLPQNCFHNYEQLDMNNDFYPFGGRPKLDNKMLDEVFTIRSDEAFSDAGSMVSLEVIFSTNSEYIMPKGSTNLQIAWEYPVDIAKWNLLEIEDDTENFTKNGTISFKVPKDIVKIALNGEDGFWIRARILSGDYGEEERTEFNEKSGEIDTIPATLRPPLLNKVLVHYTLVRKDLSNCFVLNNFVYREIIFDKNRPVNLFIDQYSHEEALFLAFDSYINNDTLNLFFDVENELIDDRNVLTKQRVLEWSILKDNQWVEVEVDDKTDGLTKSGDIKVFLKNIDSLEKFTVYIEEYERLWIKVRVKFNALKNFPTINSILLNSVKAYQKETFENEYIGKSTGLPNMKFKLNYKNLSTPPIITVADIEYKAVDRFVNHNKNDKVFRFNGVTGEIEFGDGVYGEIPELGSYIVAKKYSTTIGKSGNLQKNKLSVLRESINYIDSVTNISLSTGGEDADSLNDLKKYAPSVLKTMERAVNIDDYELLAENFSPFIQKAKCNYINNEVIILILTKNILENNGFINNNLLEDLEKYLTERSLITIKPIVIAPKIVNIKLFLKLKFTIENYSVMEEDLKIALMKTTKEYLNPFTGYNGSGFPIAKELSKGDLHNIINKTNSNFYLNEVRFQKSKSREFLQKISLSYNELINVVDIVFEDISYDI